MNAPLLNLSEEAAAARAAETTRMREINALGEQFEKFGARKIASAAVESGATLDATRAQVMNAMAAAQTQNITAVGLSRNEVQRYSVLRAIRTLVDPNYKGGDFERAVSLAICQRGGFEASPNGGFFVPTEVQHRDLTAGAPTGGGNLVATDLQASSFIELLRARSVLAGLGATMLPGLVGNVAIPKQTGSATAYWLTNEAIAITESQQTIGQLGLTPRNLGAYTELSRQLMMQSTPAADAMVMNDLARVLALSIDLAGLEGSGAAGQPTGISNTAGIGSVTGTSMAYAGILEFQTDVAGGNALANNSAYLTTPAVAALLLSRQRFASTDSPLWAGSVLDGTVSGFNATTTTQMTAASMIFGDYSQVVIGEWGFLELALNPYANFTAAISGIRAIQTVDIGIRQAAAFSRAVSIT
jgi:HK97 family phage major capsid protein